MSEINDLNTAVSSAVTEVDRSLKVLNRALDGLVEARRKTDRLGAMGMSTRLKHTEGLGAELVELLMRVRGPISVVQRTADGLPEGASLDDALRALDDNHVHLGAVSGLIKAAIAKLQEAQQRVREVLTPRPRVAPGEALQAFRAAKIALETLRDAVDALTTAHRNAQEAVQRAVE